MEKRPNWFVRTNDSFVSWLDSLTADSTGKIMYKWWKVIAYVSLGLFVAAMITLQIMLLAPNVTFVAGWVPWTMWPIGTFMVFAYFMQDWYKRYL